MATDGLDVTIETLRIDGQTLSVELAQALTAADIARTIDGAPTFTVSVLDPHRTILSSGLVSQRITMQVDTISFELVQVRKSGDAIELTFEDLIAASLRRHNDPRKAAAGTMSRVDFVKMLVAEEPWITVYVPPGVQVNLSKEELLRGNPDGPLPPPNNPDANKEDTWTASGRIMGDIGWRRFSDGHVLWLVPDSFLIAQDPEVVIDEGSPGVDWIDFDYDAGKPIATATVTCRADRWDHPPGKVIGLSKSGPADGNWIISNIKRSVFVKTASIELTKPQPELPEPEAPQMDTTTVDGLTGDGTPDDTGDGPGLVAHSVPSSSGYIWPVSNHPISSGFGMRAGHMHSGIDIAVPVGTPVGAIADGTCTFAGSLPGYGNVVYLLHAGGVYSRYGHLSKIQTRNGDQVTQGQQIGLSGGAAGAEGSGDSTGPHLHLEIRPGDTAEDPMKFLGDTARPSSRTNDNLLYGRPS